MRPTQTHLPVRAAGLLVAASLAVATLTACSNDATTPAASADTNASDVQEVVRTFLLAFNNHDGKTLIDQLNNTACTEVFGATCQDLRTHTEDLFAGQPAVELRELGAPSITADKASLAATTRIQGGLHASQFQLVVSNGSWVIENFQVDSETSLPVPDGVPVVEATLRDNAFDLDEAALSSGLFAISITNAGKETHELVIKRVDIEADLKVALTSGAKQPPANTTFTPVAASATIEPGQTSTLVLAEMLPSGHYFILDELEDAQGVSHLARGMATEFTVK